MNIRKSFVLCLLCIASMAFPENLRGKLTSEIAAGNGETVSFIIDSLVAVDIENESDLLQGIEINISIPPEIRRYRDSFILNIYKNVSPEPSAGVTSYNGDSVFQYVLPSTAKFYIQLPVAEGHDLQSIQGTRVVSTVSPIEQFPLLLTILPVMKGIPPAVYSAQLDMTVEPIYFPKGKLIVSIKDKESGEDLKPETGTITIDNTAVGTLTEAIQLRTGMHRLTVDIPGYEVETTNFAVEQGITSTISVEMKRAVPTFTIEAPQEAKIFIDGTLFEGIHGRMEEITPGKHTILFKIGDYSISKEIEINEGKNYNISLFFDIFIKED